MICFDCVTHPTLKDHIRENGEGGVCHYCGTEGTVVDRTLIFQQILDRVAENTATENDLSQYEYWMLFEGGSDDIPIAYLDVVLSEWAELGEELFFDDLYDYAPNYFKTNDREMDRHYFADGGALERNIFEDKWNSFIQDIRHTHRFFNASAGKFLDSVFGVLCRDDGSLKTECIRTISRGEPLYRARSASTREQVMKIVKAPASEFGPPPKDRASSQRMTPNGISTIYCALERETCLSEIRAITGDNVVSIAMTPIERLVLLDLTKLDRIDVPQLSILDKGYLEAMHLKAFISSLVKKMSKPKGPNDELSYLSSQVVFEYLRLRFGCQVEGLIFPSVQTGEIGKNVVLFPEASIVSGRNFPLDNDYVENAEAPVIRPFEPAARLYCVPDSLRYHKVTAIVTQAHEYKYSEDLFLSDLARNRLGVR
ncbi:RES family NAD+ phosphorylase [Pseudomonas protegens]|uniref:RES family NAD+ phosphorylase n=1 Tax=Pseudomonas protegens TaxID=380021 RepID=UPI0038096151